MNDFVVSETEARSPLNLSDSGRKGVVPSVSLHVQEPIKAFKSCLPTLQPGNHTGESNDNLVALPPNPNLLSQADFKPNYVKLLEANKDKLDSCSRSFYITLKQHIATGKHKIIHKPLTWGQRNCMLCYKVRKRKIKSRLRPLWDSIPDGTPTTHLWLTFPRVPLQDMTISLFRFMRKQAQLFLRRIRNTNYRQWGQGVWELKYDPETHSIHPHYHLVSFSYTIPIGKAVDSWDPKKPTIRGLWHDINKDNHKNPELSGYWYGIKGKSYIADGRYSPKRKQGEGKKAHTKRLQRRKYGILDYFCRRVAYAGLVMGKVRDKTGKNREVPLGPIPDSIYINLIHGSRLFFSFGSTTEYWIADVKKPWDISMKPTLDYNIRKRTNIPKGILQTWSYRVREIEDKKAEYREFFLGTIKTGHLIEDSDPPPDWILDIETLKGKFKEIFEAEGDTKTEAVCWIMAFREMAEEHGYYDGIKEGCGRGTRPEPVQVNIQGDAVCP